MRKISFSQIVFFQMLLAVIVVLGVWTTWIVFYSIPLGDFRGIVLMLAGAALTYCYGFGIYRLFLLCMPLTEGKLAEGSRAEFAANVNNLFYLLLFNSLICTRLLPVPLMRLIYKALGARMGENTYSVGVILDPPLTELGDNCIVGHDAVLFSHAIEGRDLALARTRIGNNVTIGAKAVVMSGVTIGDHAIVSAGAVVLKDSCIGPGEVWGGVPARRIR